MMAPSLLNKTRSSFKVRDFGPILDDKVQPAAIFGRLDGVELKENLVIARKGVERNQCVQNDDRAQDILRHPFDIPFSGR
jgi:hypothetical protein